MSRDPSTPDPSTIPPAAGAATARPAKPGISRMSSAARAAAAVATGDPVSFEPLAEPAPSTGRSLPLLARPRVAGLRLAEWLGDHRDAVDRHLDRHGAVLFRGFGVADAEELEAVVAAGAGSALLRYTYRSTPRREVEGRVYTTTEYPADQAIPLHCENAYAASWPLRIGFCCLVPATTGGATPIADSRRVHERIPAAVRERFAARGVRYVRNYGGGVDLPWQEVFQTADRDEVERFCAASGIELEWLAGDRLRTAQSCPAVARHPRTGEAVWFNQAHLFHPSSLPPAVHRSLLDSFGADFLPRDATHGDGTPLAAEDLEAIRAAYDAETVSFPWQAGDLLWVDNMLVAHGRSPFSGPRRVLVGMAVGTTWDDVRSAG